MLKCFTLTVVGIACVGLAASKGEEPKAPATVKQLFADFDPRKDDIDAKLVRE